MVQFMLRPKRRHEATQEQKTTRLLGVQQGKQKAFQMEGKTVHKTEKSNSDSSQRVEK